VPHKLVVSDMNDALSDDFEHLVSVDLRSFGWGGFDLHEFLDQR
jgi:hypothetical protein